MKLLKGSLNLYYVDLILELFRKEFKVRYKSSILGYLWSIALPFTQAITFYFAFKFIMRIQIENYTLFLIIGLFPWQWFSNSILASTNALISNASLIKKTLFLRESLLYATVLNDMVHFILSIPIILVVLFIYGKSISFNFLFFFPSYIIIQFLVTSGISLIVSSVNLFFRDLERIVLVSLNILFYLTPILYEEKMIPEEYYHYLLKLNPMFPLIVLYRDLILKNTVNEYYLITSIFQAIIIFLIGYIVFNKLKWKFAEVL